MCGIAGTIGTQDERSLKKILERISHRGPDDEGMYHDPARRLYLGHRRLSIIDLSPLGHQPMSSNDGAITVVFNGEIYNYKPLADDLRGKGRVFRSHSDTEVIIHGYAVYGADIFKKIDGMWAIALYDKTNGKLFLSRDPAGMKPLYVYRDESKILFASEIGALAATLPSQARDFDSTAAVNYLAHGYVPGETTFYSHIQSIASGTTIEINLSNGKESRGTYIPKRGDVPASLGDAELTFTTLFERSVRASLQADVPVGIFLSGGVDSSLVAYHAQKSGARPQAFTIGFEEGSFDESATAARIARHFGFPQTTHVMRAADIVRDIDAIFDSFGQPFADTSSLPTFYVSRLAHEHGYKVVLTGDGADELFGGYPTHYLPDILRWYQHAPAWFDTLAQSAADTLPTRFSALGTKEKLTRFLQGARYPYARAHAMWKRIFTDAELDELVSDREMLANNTSFDRYFEMMNNSSTDAVDQVMKVDFMTFLTSDCLVKSDICAMQSGVEVRAPFLNRDIIDFAWYLPSEMKARPFQTKILLRQSLSRVLPREIARLPKHGFVPPLAHWLATDLKEMMLDKLSSEAIARIGFVNYTYVNRLVEEHLARTHDHTKKIWTLMSLSHFFARKSS